MKFFGALTGVLTLVSSLCFSLDAVPAEYPNFYGNPHLDQRMQTMITPYLFPIDHPARASIDWLFGQKRVTENMDAIRAAGFVILAHMPRSFVTVVRHPSVPGFVFKLYLDDETRIKKKTASWQWLVQRCMGASKIRELIARKNMKHYFAPDKWIYIFPIHPLSREPNPHPFLVVATDIEPILDEGNRHAWKTEVTKEHLNELFEIMVRGYATTQVANIPFTQRGQFAFMDTEYPCRELELRSMKKYFSKEMGKYWEELIEKAESKGR